MPCLGASRKGTLYSLKSFSEDSFLQLLILSTSGDDDGCGDGIIMLLMACVFPVKMFPLPPSYIMDTVYDYVC